MAQEKKFKISSLVDGVLLALAVGMLVLEGSLLISAKKDGMPSLFGKTFLRVLTGSMDGPDTPSLYLTREGNQEQGRVNGVYYTLEEADKAGGGVSFELKKNGPWMLGIDTAAVLEKKSFEQVVPGDIVTFRYDIPTTDGVYPDQLVSHRVIEIVDSTLYCYGDAYPKAGYPYSISSSAYQGVQRIKKEDYVGTIVSKSDFLGAVLVMTSSPYFVPAVVGVPLLAMAGFSFASSFKRQAALKKEEKRRVQALVYASGVDPNDEANYEREVEKASIKVQIQMEMEEEKEKQKEILRAQLKKEKDRFKKEMRKEAKRSHGKE